jgi:hypothetical protein
MGSNKKSAMKLTYGQGRTENRRLAAGNKVAAIFEHHGDQSNGEHIPRKHWGCSCNFRRRCFQRYAESHNCGIHAIIHCLIREHEPTGLLDKFNSEQGQPNKKEQAGYESTRHGIYSSNEGL